ncbi:MAG: isopentenyl transferase family protein, partial [Brevinematia bacterium]
MEVIGIVGPTSSGKSYIAHNLARELRKLGIESEIISCDSVQVYKYFDVGTDKVPSEFRREFNYHCLDILEPNEGRFSAGKFRKMFDEIVLRLVREGKVGILVGGTGLYYKAVKVGIFEGP